MTLKNITKLLILLAVTTSLFCGICLASEIITDFKEESIPVLNAELRKTNTSIAQTQSDVDAVELIQTAMIGMIVLWPTDTAPTGYLLCYGQAVSRTTYAALYAIIGTTYGVGDGSTTFNLPDMRGRVPLGQDDMGGSSANRVTAAAADSLAGAGGEETHTLDITEIPAHHHDTIYQAGVAGGDPFYGGSGGPTSKSSGDTGGGAAHNNLQPYLTLNYIIKF